MERANIKPFFVEVSVSSSSICEVCYHNIVKDELRIASMLYSKDKGSVPGWYHIWCLIPETGKATLATRWRAPGNSQRKYPTTLDQIDGLEFLSFQSDKEYEKIKNIIEAVNINVQSLSPPPKTFRFLEEEEDVPNYKYSKRVVKLTMKDGNVMDSNAISAGVLLLQSAHIYKENDKSYSETLCKVDLEKGENLYYKVQILESDKLQSRYWLFRSFGRIGEIHTSKHFCDLMMTKGDAVLAFDRVLQQTEKLNYIAMKIDYGQVKMINPEPYIKLEPQLDKFVRKIFSVPLDSYELDFELDVGKTPLGPLSETQLVKAYGILAGLTEMIDQKEENPEESDPGFDKVVTELTNQYLTLVPRGFPQNDPPLLNTAARIQTEVTHVENLMEMDLQLVFSPKEKPTTHSLYQSLNCDIVVIKKDSDIYKVLNKYLTNTLAPHLQQNEYTVTLDNIYSVSRQGENELFSKTKHVGNRKLLWHGSPTANIKGILSNGLGLSGSHHRYGCITPESSTSESRSTIFFADMASKSISYCKSSRENNTGALLLSEVALGNLAAERWSYTPTKSNTTAIGSTYNFLRGRVEPDPAEFHVLPNSVVVPYGKHVVRDPLGNQLNPPGHRPVAYNEYIVFDKAQVNLQFLLEITLNYP